MLLLRQHVQKAAVVKIAAVLTPPEPTLAPVTKFGEPVAVGRGHSCASAIRGAAACSAEALGKVSL